MCLVNAGPLLVLSIKHTTRRKLVRLSCCCLQHKAPASSHRCSSSVHTQVAIDAAMLFKLASVQTVSKQAAVSNRSYSEWPECLWLCIMCNHNMRENKYFRLYPPDIKMFFVFQLQVFSAKYRWKQGLKGFVIWSLKPHMEVVKNTWSVNTLNVSQTINTAYLPSTHLTHDCAWTCSKKCTKTSTEFKLHKTWKKLTFFSFSISSFPTNLGHTLF